MPPSGASGKLIAPADSFEIPVFVRRSSPLNPGRRPRATVIDRVTSPWPAVRDVPPSGAYLVATTWRDVIDAATTVGRDPLPWLTAVPALAWAEFIARRSPLIAYLQRVRNASSNPGLTGYYVAPNVVYADGTERTAQAAFAYRIGMTMAEWVCRLMGLGPTEHAESSPPPGAGPAWSSLKGPDLVGSHWQAPTTWLVEAKGARRAGRALLAKGADQLCSHGLMTGPHARVLCGTSIEHRIFVTVDIEVDEGMRSPVPRADLTRRSPDDDDGELVALARSRMLSYYALRALPPASLAVRPVGLAVADARRPEESPSLVVPLENDESTREERMLARDPDAYRRLRPPSSRRDMLTGQVPGTDLIVGMSRRLYGACGSLATKEAEIMSGLQNLPVAYQPQAGWDQEDPGVDVVDEEVLDSWNRERRREYASRESQARSYLYETARRGYELGGQRSWAELINNEPAIAAGAPAGFLESATPDTYLAIDIRTATAAAQ